MILKQLTVFPFFHELLSDARFTFFLFRLSLVFGLSFIPRVICFQYWVVPLLKLWLCQRAVLFRYILLDIDWGWVWLDTWLELFEEGHAFFNGERELLAHLLNLLGPNFFLDCQLLEVGRPNFLLFVQSLQDVVDGQLQQTEEKLIAAGQQRKPVDLVCFVRVEVFELGLNRDQTRKDQFQVGLNFVCENRQLLDSCLNDWGRLFVVLGYLLDCSLVENWNRVPRCVLRISV